MGVAESEQRAGQGSRGKCQRAVQVTTLLALGIRKMRAEYARLTDSWCELTRLAVGLAHQPPPAAAAQAPAAQIPRATESAAARMLDDCLQSPRGLAVVQQLRWSVPTHSALVARIRTEFGPAGAGE